MSVPKIGEGVTTPGFLLGPGRGDHWVLRVVGDSMVGEHLLPGDFIILQKREAVEGDMVVAQIGDETTVKRLSVEGEIAHLGSLSIPLPDLSIRGVVVGLMRKY